MRQISLHSKRKLKASDADRFAQLEPKLFVEVAKVVCSTGALPQKELHECWQMASRVHQEFPEALHIADVAAGHGLLAWILVLLARRSESPIFRTAVALDINRPKSADRLAAAMTTRWPDLADTVLFVEGSIDAVTSTNDSDTLFVAAHACGSLSDRVLLTAIKNRNPVAIMPCCHSLRKQTASLSMLAFASGLQSFSGSGSPNAIDEFRVDALTALGYSVVESSIQAEITAFNRIFMGKPLRSCKIDFGLNSSESQAFDSIKSRGEIRAYEKVQSVDVSNRAQVRALSRRPSREWVRSFDLSFWVDDEETGKKLADALTFLVDRIFSPEKVDDAVLDVVGGAADRTDGTIGNATIGTSAVTRMVSIVDQYVEATTQRRAFTYRIEIASSTGQITKNDAGALRAKVCRDLGHLTQMRRNNFELRGR